MKRLGSLLLAVVALTAGCSGSAPTRSAQSHVAPNPSLASGCRGLPTARHSSLRLGFWKLEGVLDASRLRYLCARLGAPTEITTGFRGRKVVWHYRNGQLVFNERRLVSETRGGGNSSYNVTESLQVTSSAR